MLNVLPPTLKQEYRYARLNVSLRRWIMLFAVAIIGLGIIATYGLVSLQHSTTQYEKRIAKTEALFKQENFDGTQQQIQDISNSFKLVVKVLGQEVLFSELLKQIGASIPANANLTSLNINQSQAAIDITANATDYATATQVQVNLSDPRNKIFSDADIINISCNANAANPRYPCTVNIKALFAPNNPFLFINNKAGAP